METFKVWFGRIFGIGAALVATGALAMAAFGAGTGVYLFATDEHRALQSELYDVRSQLSDLRSAACPKPWEAVRLQLPDAAIAALRSAPGREATDFASAWTKNREWRDRLTQACAELNRGP